MYHQSIWTSAAQRWKQMALHVSAMSKVNQFIAKKHPKKHNLKKPEVKYGVLSLKDGPTYWLKLIGAERENTLILEGTSWNDGKDVIPVSPGDSDAWNVAATNGIEGWSK